MEIPPIVDLDWLADHDGPDHADLVLCEVRTSMAGDDVDTPTRAGVRLLTLERDLATPPSGVRGRHPLPSPDSFAASLATAGIAPHDLVVAFDRHHGAYAARLVWMLRIIGQPAALLDGEPSERTHPAPATLVERPAIAWPRAAVADADDVTEHLAAGGHVIDSRDASRYAGVTEPIDPIAGHIPGTINIPFAGNLGAGRFRSPAELATRFAAVADDPDAIVHCGSGVTACHNALAMEAAGLPRPRVYVGSWSGWIADPARAIASGDDP